MNGDPDGTHAHLPELVRRYLARSLPPGPSTPATVRVRQTGEMWKRPEAGAMSFLATEDFAVERVAFSWRARFSIAGPLRMTVADGFAEGAGRLRVSLLGIPLQTETGPETDLGEAMRYLAELAWAPQAIVANRQLAWRELDEKSVEVSCAVGERSAVVRWEFDDAGDLVRSTGMRPYRIGKTFVERRWGGDFGAYEDFAGIRIPGTGQAWWELPEGRFVYWNAQIEAIELIGG